MVRDRRPTIQQRLGDWALAYRVVLGELRHEVVSGGGVRLRSNAEDQRVAAEVAAVLVSTVRPAPEGGTEDHGDEP